jgi:chromosome segregation ATPase
MSSYSPYYGRSPGRGGNSGAPVSPTAAITTVGFVASAATIYQNAKSISDIRKELEDLKKKMTDISHVASSAESSAARSANSFKSLSQSFGSILSSSVPSENKSSKSSHLEEELAKVKGYVVENAKKLNKRFDSLESGVERLEASVLEIFERLEKLEQINIAPN